MIPAFMEYNLFFLSGHSRYFQYNSCPKPHRHANASSNGSISMYECIFKSLSRALICRVQWIRVLISANCNIIECDTKPRGMNVYANIYPRAYFQNSLHIGVQSNGGMHLTNKMSFGSILAHP